MSLTISPSAGDDNVCKTTKLASLSSGLVVPGVSLSTSSVSSSGHRVMPGLYSDSQVGQNIAEFQVSSLKFQVFVSLQGTRTNLKPETWNLKLCLHFQTGSLQNE